MSFDDELVSKAASDNFARKIEELAAKLEPNLARAVRDVLVSHVAGIDVDAIEKAIRAGDTAKVMELVGTTDPAKAQRVIEALEDAVWSAGKLTVVESPVLNGAAFVFQRLNPALTRWIDTYSFNLIKDIDDKTREAVRATLRRGMIAGDNPIQTARAVKQSVGLTDGMARAVQNYRRELETFHTRRSAKGWGLGNERSSKHGISTYAVDENGKPTDGILERRLRDMRYDAQLKRAMETKTPLKPEQIERMVEAYQQRYIQDRSRNIARTESLRACNAGVHDAWRQAVADNKVDASLVRKQWVLAKDERTCPLCKAIPKANPKLGVPIEQDFRSPKGQPVRLPPAHPSCRCGVFFRLYEPEQIDAERVASAA